MTKKNILHMVTPLDNVSAFDVNMAIDAGYDVVMPYTGIDSSRIGDLVQDAIFSRPPGSVAQTAIFIGGQDVGLAAEMITDAQAALVPPFQLSVFADPNGAYTTAAALVAKAEQLLKTRTNSTVDGKNVMIFGGGPVGMSAAVLLARLGARVGVAKLTNSPRSSALEELAEHFGVELHHHDAQTDALKETCLKDCHILFATAKEGVQVVSPGLLDGASELMVAADVNAVPPAGIAGLDIMAKGTELKTASQTIATLGALAIGQIKYQLQYQLLKDMLVAEAPLMIDFHTAFVRAREIVADAS